MTEEQITSVEEAVAPPVESEPTQDVQTEEVQPNPEPKRESDQEYNWREARRKMDALEQRNFELEDRVNRMSTPRQRPPDDEIDLARLDDDTIVTAKQAKALAQQTARQVADEIIRQREMAGLDKRLKLEYPDFDQVVTKDNIELLKQNEPELAASLTALAHEPYTQAAAAYKLLRKNGRGVSEEVAKNKAKAEANSRKPVSVQSVTRQNSAIGNASIFENGLTPELKKQLWKEMQQAAKG